MNETLKNVYFFFIFFIFNIVIFIFAVLRTVPRYAHVESQVTTCVSSWSICIALFF